MRWDWADLRRVEVWASLLVGVLRTVRIGGVEVALDVGYGHHGVSLRRTSGPVGVPVTPVVEEKSTTLGRNLLCHLPEELTVNIEGDTVCGPIETVLVEHAIRLEGERCNLVGSGTSGIVSVGNRFRRLQDQVYSASCLVEFVRKKLHVDFLGVVVVLEESAVI